MKFTKDDVFLIWADKIKVVRLDKLCEVVEALRDEPIEHDGSYVAWSNVKKKINEKFGDIMEDKQPFVENLHKNDTNIAFKLTKVLLDSEFIPSDDKWRRLTLWCKKDKDNVEIDGLHTIEDDTK